MTVCIRRFRCPGRKAKPKAADSFLNRRSLLASGIAGIITMAIANALWVTFLLSPRWVALALSFLIGFVAFFGARIPPGWRTVYGAFSFCVVFLVAVGSNRVGEVLTMPHDILPHRASTQLAEQQTKAQGRALQQLDMDARRRDSGGKRKRPENAGQAATVRNNSEPPQISQHPVDAPAAPYPRFFSDW